MGVKNALVLLGTEIKKQRAALQLTQEDLAHRADLTTSFISRLENGRQTPSFLVLLAVAQALEIPAAALVLEVERALQMDALGAAEASEPGT